VPVDEHVEIHRIEILSRRIRESNDISRRDHPRHPIGEVSAFLLAADVASSVRDPVQSLEALSR